ncbi:UNVERIFIED_CONTAM: hypothetical protein Sradi_3573600 [Sesamum radiatum]|uniref:Retrovirus-related Pol polyprotein from transposon TNT 1-94 n=1 Tax=Sesamum radiatum TaxID=300843 RepID=A0AAW2QGY7_SESRA
MYLMVSTRPDIAYAPEYIATTEAFKEAIWLKGILSEIGFLKNNVTVFSDSQSSIQLCKNPVFHDRTKHIEVLAKGPRVLWAMMKAIGSGSLGFGPREDMLINLWPKPTWPNPESPGWQAPRLSPLLTT